MGLRNIFIQSLFDDDKEINGINSKQTFTGFFDFR